MEYSNTYERTRNIHLEPTSRLIEIRRHLYHTHHGIQIQLIPIYDGKRLGEPIPMTKVLNSIVIFNQASHIKVELMGDFPESELEEMANAIGQIFMEEELKKNKEKRE